VLVEDRDVPLGSAPVRRWNFALGCGALVTLASIDKESLAGKSPTVFVQ
jgi:hypothetical protein